MNCDNLGKSNAFHKLVYEHIGILVDYLLPDVGGIVPLGQKLRP